MHGYQPGAAHPTTSLVLSHKHPDDYADIALTLENIRRTRKQFSTRNRIIDLQGRIHKSSSRGTCPRRRYRPSNRHTWLLCRRN